MSWNLKRRYGGMRSFKTCKFESQTKGWWRWWKSLNYKYLKCICSQNSHGQRILKHLAKNYSHKSCSELIRALLELYQKTTQRSSGFELFLEIHRKDLLIHSSSKTYWISINLTAEEKFELSFLRRATASVTLFTFIKSIYLRTYIFKSFNVLS